MASIHPASNASRAAARFEGFRLSREHSLTLWFYLIVPALIGFLLGWVRAGRTAGLPLDVALTYWILVSVISTITLGLVTAAIAPTLRRLQSPLWLTLFLGQLIGGLVLVEPLMRALRAGMRTFVYSTFPTETPWSLMKTAMTLPSNTLFWIGLNLLFFYAFKLTRFGYVPGDQKEQVFKEPVPLEPVPLQPIPTAISTPTPTLDCPAFMKRVKPERRGELLALQSDGHYLHVYTDAGSDLILYRLADAIQEVPASDGEQVHRSWWVADRAIGSEHYRDKLKLSNGLEIPVSRSYRVAARRRGWIIGSP